MVNDQVAGHLSSRIGRRVNYTPPKDVSEAGGHGYSGTIIDEVWADPNLNTKPPKRRESPEDWGDYSFCAQLIQWDNGEHSIRLAYYRRSAGQNRWRFGAQFTVDTGWRTIKALLRGTLAKENWFKDKPTIHIQSQKKD